MRHLNSGSGFPTNRKTLPQWDLMTEVNSMLKKRAAHVGRPPAAVIQLVTCWRENRLATAEDMFARNLTNLISRRRKLSLKTRLRFLLALQGMLTETLNDVCRGLPPETFAAEPPLPEDTGLPEILHLPTARTDT
jgi:hypothetical protein